MTGAQLGEGLLMQLRRLAFERAVEVFVGIELGTVAGERVNGDGLSLLHQPSFDRSTVMHAHVVEEEINFAPARLSDQSGHELDEPVRVEGAGINHPPRKAPVRHRALDGGPIALGLLAGHRRLAAGGVPPRDLGLIVHARLIAPEDFGSLGFGARGDERIGVREPLTDVLGFCS